MTQSAPDGAAPALAGAAVALQGLSYAYGQRAALNELSLRVEPGEIFGLLGPNGSGKSTLFRVLSTLVRPSGGSAHIFGRDVIDQRDAVRGLIGVVFQSPSLDKHLTARENLVHQGHLYGLSGGALRDRVADALSGFGLADRADDRVGTFSGGMRRRIEVAKSLLHRPRLLLMDEPSTGLDPAARIDLWQLLQQVSRQDGVTVLLTTHLMEEAEKCDRLAILNAGRLLACDAPEVIRRRIGGDVIVLTTQEPNRLAEALRAQLQLEPTVVGDDAVRLESPQGHRLVPQIFEAAPPGLIESCSVGKPTLEDVFIGFTGQRFSSTSEPSPLVKKRQRH